MYVKYYVQKVTDICFSYSLRIVTISNFPSGAPIFGCTRSRSQTREVVTGYVERADYTQEMDCYYFDSWPVHR